MAFNKQTIKDIDIAGKRVLVRVDYNVPLGNNGEILDNLRIKASLPTLNYLLDKGCRLVLMSHLGRPEGKKDLKFSLRNVVTALSKELKKSVEFVDDCLKPTDPNAEISLLENVRFYPEEEANDSDFAAKLAKNGDVYVDDAFGVVHHPGASLVAITKILPSVAGLLLESEITAITTAIDDPDHPFVAVLGGAKISDKIELIDNLMSKVDRLLVGGAMANTFLAAKGLAIGKSKFEPDDIDVAQRIMESAGDKKVEIFLPDIDTVVGSTLTPEEPRRIVYMGAVKPTELILDIGPESLAKFENAIKDAKTIIWNGTLGMTELPQFAVGSQQFALELAARKATIIIGGGDTSGFIHHIGMADKFTLVSTGGGVALELMAGKKLEAVEALPDKA